MTVDLSKLMSTYPEPIVDIERGEGCFVYDAEGKRYLDFGSGIAVTSLGHSEPNVLHALFEQSSRLWHTSNFYSSSVRADLSELLVRYSFADRVFFCNSGLESFEGALKLARSYHYREHGRERYGLVSFEGGFHGRSIGALSTMDEDKRKGFGEVDSSSSRIGLYDEVALDKSVDDNTAAIIIEPIQGEGGIIEIREEFLRRLREIATDRGCLLIFDEIQCGMGRCGSLWSYEDCGVTPDIMIVAKALANGFPIGAILSSEEASKGFYLGRHGSTFGGNCLAMAVAKVVLTTISQPDMLSHIREMGTYLSGCIGRLIESRPDLYREARGRGLIQGIVTTVKPMELARKLKEEGLLVIPASDNVIRLLPPFIVGTQEIEQAIGIMSTIR